MRKIVKAKTVATLCCVIFLGGCVTSMKDFDPKKASPGSAIAFGRVIAPAGWICNVGLKSSDNTFYKQFEPDKNGLLAVPLKSGQVKMGVIDCNKGRLTEIRIDVEDKPKFEASNPKTYFGDISIYIGPKQKATLTGIVLGTYGQREAGFTISDNMVETSKLYRTSTNDNADKMTKSLFR